MEIRRPKENDEFLEGGVNIAITSDDIWKASNICSCNLNSTPEAMTYFDKRVLEALHEWIKSNRYTKFVIEQI